MLAIAGKTAGPNGLTFWREPMSARGVTKAKIPKNINQIFFNSKK